MKGWISANYERGTAPELKYNINSGWRSDQEEESSIIDNFIVVVWRWSLPRAPTDETRLYHTIVLASLDLRLTRLKTRITCLLIGALSAVDLPQSSSHKPRGTIESLEERALAYGRWGSLLATKPILNRHH